MNRKDQRYSNAPIRALAAEPNSLKNQDGLSVANANASTSKTITPAPGKSGTVTRTPHINSNQSPKTFSNPPRVILRKATSNDDEATENFLAGAPAGYRGL